MFGTIAVAAETVAVVAGAVAVLAGLLLAIRSLRPRSREQFASQRAQTVHEIAVGAVALRGTVAAGPDGLLTEPLSGRSVVWYRLTGFAPRAAGRAHDDQVEVHSEHDGRDFHVDDGSRSVPLVSVADAGYVVPMDMYVDDTAMLADGPWTRRRLSEQHVAALRARAARPTTRMVRADCHALEPGTPVTVVGWLERGDRGPTVVGRPPEHPLIVYAMGADDPDRAGHSRRVRWPIALAIVMVAAGAAGIWWGRSVLGLT